MQNFGLKTLRLVNPEEFDAYRIEGIAHRSADLISATTLHTTLQDAVGDASFILGTTGRARTAGRNYIRPREAGSLLVERAATGTVTIILGREDRGLTNEALDLCHAVMVIPTDPEHPSLNLAQACLVAAYEIFLAVGGGERCLRNLPRCRWWRTLPAPRAPSKPPPNSGRARRDLRCHRDGAASHRVLQGPRAFSSNAYDPYDRITCYAWPTRSSTSRGNRLRNRSLHQPKASRTWSRYNSLNLVSRTAFDALTLNSSEWQTRY